MKHNDSYKTSTTIESTNPNFIKIQPSNIFNNFSHSKAPKTTLIQSDMRASSEKKILVILLANLNAAGGSFRIGAPSHPCRDGIPINHDDSS